jgi:hypothetical protein
VSKKQIIHSRAIAVNVPRWTRTVVASHHNSRDRTTESSIKTTTGNLISCSEILLILWSRSVSTTISSVLDVCVQIHKIERVPIRSICALHSRSILLQDVQLNSLQRTLVCALQLNGRYLNPRLLLVLQCLLPPCSLDAPSLSWPNTHLLEVDASIF